MPNQGCYCVCLHPTNLFPLLQVQEISIDYTNCNTTAPQARLNYDPSQGNDLEPIPADRVSAKFSQSMKTAPQWGWAREQYNFSSGVTQDTNVCILSIDIPNDIKPPILFYYRLTNFYQNHRRYVKSVDIQQLKGNVRTAADLSSGDCNPLDVAPNGKPYYPCGLIANSMFNDTFGNLTLDNAVQDANGNEINFYNMTVEGTSWAHEGDLYGKTKYKPDDVVPPPNWQEQYPNGTYGDSLPNLHTWEQFQVWMRTAGLPTFSKLYQRNDNDVLRQGTYRLKIYDRTMPPTILCSTTKLTCSRLSRREVQGHQVHSHLDPHRHGWQEPVPRHCLPCRWRALHSARCCVPRRASHQA